LQLTNLLEFQTWKNDRKCSIIRHTNVYEIISQILFFALYSSLNLQGCVKQISSYFIEHGLVIDENVRSCPTKWII